VPRQRGGLAGLELLEVRAIPAPGTAGRILVRNGRGTPREFALAILVGPRLDPRLAAEADWPLVPLEDDGGDRKQLRELTEEMGYDRADYVKLLVDAWALAGRDDFQRLASAFCTALAVRPVLEGEVLEGVIAIATGREPTCST